MQKTLFTIVTLCLVSVSYGQTTEFRISLNSGLFSFAGEDAEYVSFINYNDRTESGNTNNPYGSKGGLGIGLSGNIKRVSKENFIFGADLGYELLRSKTKINTIHGNTGSSTYSLDATGKTFLNSNFINLHLFMGHRLPANKINLDFTGGLEIGYCLNATEKGSATASDGTKYETSRDRKTIDYDIRPRVQIEANYKKVGAYIGYSFGLTNYKSNFDGGAFACYARLLRFGLTYQIK
ncbi:MAG: hypothetical protein RBR47_03450 [Bacteroidales bacterium]|jgi:hypothetical protein|nr:hypothetical protein [Bacteroidales bacterium]MDY0333992.1 hypothetical protein [Bacteroidales bacterium]NCU35936.1 PorT family protein [Candidatus Falkowbacteria bacterium]